MQISQKLNKRETIIIGTKKTILKKKKIFRDRLKKKEKLKK